MSAITSEEFLDSAKDFLKISDRIKDSWKLHRNEVDVHKSYLAKETFINSETTYGCTIFKAQYVISYNQSYEVPLFSFNIWDASGVLLTLDKIRHMSFININEKDFYSVITQQEHPIFFRPYFIMHPCHTAELLSIFKNKSKNIIVTFLGLITPLIQLKVSLEYGL